MKRPKPYQPSNGTEGMMFCEEYCDQCINQHPDPHKEPQCMILCHTMVYDPGEKEYPSEWIYDDKGQPTCTAFVKWDWGNDDGEWNEPAPPEPDPDPNQLMMFPIWEGMNFGDDIIITPRAIIESDIFS